MRIDLHTHSNISDGTDTPTGLVLKAVQAKLDVVALCDHDTFAGLDEAVSAGKRFGVKVVRGVEMSANANGVPVHLLGYGMNVNDPELNAELKKIRQSRRNRIGQICTQLTEAGLDIDEADVFALARSSSVGRPHVADALVAKGYVADRGEAFARWLSAGCPGYVAKYGTELPQAIRLLQAAGGVAIIAHPWGRKSVEVLTGEYLEYLKTQHNLDGVEVDHPEHDQQTRSLLFDLGGRLGFLRTGSSDYHGSGKTDNDLGCCLSRVSAYREIERRVKMRGGQL